MNPRIRLMILLMLCCGYDTAAAVDTETAARVEQAEANPAYRNRLLEEIVVTAEKREENIQSVPIAISAFSGEKLDALGIKSADQLPEVTPGLTFTGAAGYTIIFLRGVGTDAFLPSADPAVPIYLDGVALEAGHGVVTTLGRVKRVEVLKGPQGTLFGRNSTGGAISIITPDPGPRFGGDLQTEFGNLGTFNQQLYLNLPVADDLGVTISGYSQRNQSYTQNDAGPTLATYSRGGRVKLLWDATDNLSFNFSAIYGEESGNATSVTELINAAPVLTAFGIVDPPDPRADRHVSENVAAGTVLHSDLFSGGADWKLPWAELKVILSTQHIGEPYVLYDSDASTRPLLSFSSDNEFFTQRTGELQILSTPDTPLNRYFSWVAGAYVLQGSGGFPALNFQVGAYSGLLPILTGGQGFATALSDLLAGAGLPQLPGVTGPITLIDGGVLTSRSLSGYFQGTLHLQDMFDLPQAVNLILGARLDRETRGLEQARLSTLNPVDNQEIQLASFPVPDVSALQVPLKLELQWLPDDLMQLYASFSRAFTAPTYNTVNFFANPEPLQPSRVDTYEVGAKTQLFDQSLTLNAAAFYNKEQELLTGFVSIFSGGIVSYSNTPAARIYGAEFDATWQPLPELDAGLVLRGGVSYLNSEYTDFPDGRGYDHSTGLAFGPGLVDTGRNFTGNRVVRTPKFTADAGFNQSIGLGDAGRVELATDAYYNSGYFFLPQNDPLYATPAFLLVNGRVSYFYQPWGIEITGYVKNLTQEKYFTTAFGTDFGLAVSLNDPRTYGLRLAYSF